MNRSLSARERSGILEDLESATFDVLVIGGGITGAGIAWDAAKRGMKTALIEKNDFAFGTSSRSTKLIHGGLRYLKKGEIKLVREVGREREWLHRNAPHLVTPMPMLLPIYKGGSFGYWSASAGLYIYDRLAGVRRPERRVMHRGDEAVLMEPLLKREGLKGAGRYYEYRSDDARLTVEVLKTAVRHGAWAINFVEATDFMYYHTKVSGVRAVDRLTGKELEIRAKRIVNAAGPWVDLVRAKDHALKGTQLLLTKGVHIVVDHSKLPVRQAAYFDVPDGRMIFVIPRDGKTYIGTTDTVYTGTPDSPRTTESDRNYLLDALRGIFPGIRLDADDVETMWAGLRPLIREEGKLPSDISRRDDIWVSSSGLITIAGGKLTGFRKMAEKAVDFIAGSLSQESRHVYGPCTTDREIISGGDNGRCESFDELKELLIGHGIRIGLSQRTAEYLMRLYGSNAADIYMRMDGLDGRFEELMAERAAVEEAFYPQTEAGASLPGIESAEEAGRLPEALDDGRIAASEQRTDNAWREDRLERPEGLDQSWERAEWDERAVQQQAGQSWYEQPPQQEQQSLWESRQLLNQQQGQQQQSQQMQGQGQIRQQDQQHNLQPDEQQGQQRSGQSEELGQQQSQQSEQPDQQQSQQVEEQGQHGQLLNHRQSQDHRSDRESQQQPAGGELSGAEWRALKAEIGYCIEEEMTVHAADFLVRRTGLLYFDRERAEAIALDVLDIMAEYLHWDEREMMQQKLRLAREWEIATIAPEKES